MRALVLANGTIENPTLLRERAARWDAALVVAADGGSCCADLLGLGIHVLIGDLDSLDAARVETLRASGATVEKHPDGKDETDLELALLYAVRAGADEVAVIGALGGRLDMTLSNVLLLTHPALYHARIELWHAAQTAWLVRPPGADLSGAAGDTLSLIPLGGPAEGVSTQGLQYALNDETLAFGPARGISNVLTKASARVDLRAGLLLVVHTPGRA
jgi:thiamine pyrophosphokinase